MANYRPQTITIASGSAKSGVILRKSIATTSWGLLLANGKAYISTTALKSGTVAVWESNAALTGAPTRVTFTDVSGVYGITCKAGVALNFKFYAK